METQNAIRKSLLLVPDISGFTKFVNQTEMVHGVHIISELLELIIKNNSLGLKVAEIEGDAVLFYKYWDEPNLEEIYAQCQQMFVAFHKHLKLYERDRICDCGSCSSTPQLSLKFIAHFGDVIERNILGHFQLMGADVTLVHKLMKNNVPGNEYLLLSENVMTFSNGVKLPRWSALKSNSIEYDNIGKVDFQYETLTPLLKEVPTPPARAQKIIDPIQFSMEREFNHSMQKVFDLISSLDRKHEWSTGVIRIDYDENQVERIGTEHRCISTAGTIQIETAVSEATAEKMVFGEVSKGLFIFPSTQHVFTINKITSNSCNLKIEAHFKASFITRFILKNRLEKGLIDGMNGIERVLKADESKAI